MIISAMSKYLCCYFEMLTLSRGNNGIKTTLFSFHRDGVTNMHAHTHLQIYVQIHNI